MDEPHVEYGFDPEALTALTFAFPMPMPQPDDEEPGGSDESAAWIPESFEISYAHIREVRLPFLESQMDDVRDFFRWARTSAAPFLFWSILDGVSDGRSVYLHWPKMGEAGFHPEKDPFLGVFWLTIKIRTEDGEPFDDAWSDV